MTHNFLCPKFVNAQLSFGSKRSRILDFFDPKILIKKSDQVDYLTIEYFESRGYLENLELEFSPAQPNLFD